MGMAREFHGKVFVYQMVAFPSELQQLHGIRLFDEQSPGGRRGNGAGRRQGRADDDGTGAGGEENHLEIWRIHPEIPMTKIIFWWFTMGSKMI